MKKIFSGVIFLLSFLLFNPATAQIVNPVKWTFSVSKTNDCEAVLIFKASIEDKWHLYGQKSYGDDGPIPTSFHLTQSGDYKAIGTPSEKNMIKKFEPVFNAELNFFEHEAVFKQKVKINSNKPFEIKGNLEYMVCNDVSCQPPMTVQFSFKIENDLLCSTSQATTTSVAVPAVSDVAAPCAIDSCAVARAYFYKNGLPDPNATTAVADTAKSNLSTTAAPEAKKDLADDSWWILFFLGCLAGFSALLTPCVFPMIPMTVSFFTKRSKNKREGIKNAIIYSLSIIAIYTSIGVLFTLAFGVDALHAMSTNVWFNLFFFVMLVVFAVSFLGAFEIVLPSRFVNKMDEKSDRGGLIGIFFMAFTLALVSFSCTSAFIGPLLFSAGATGHLSGPFWGMLGFSTALSLPFGLFAAFPGWMNSLPKSGGWLNSVKVTLGLLELALAFKFASNADLVGQHHILTREVFITIWIVIFGLTGIYLMGWFKMAHDSDVKSLSVTRLFFAMIALAFTVYLIPGLWGAPLKLISGFPPPDFYSESPNGFGGSQSSAVESSSGSGTNAQAGATKIKNKKEECPNHLPCFNDYDEALAYAKKVNKPLMIDFTGWACVNCRKMEGEVWTDPEVDKRLRNDVVVVSLHVDDSTPLPKEQQSEQKLGDSDFTVNTLGTKWVYMQASRYNTNSQPLYVLIDNDEKMLTPETTHYDPDKQLYINWLDAGIAEYKKRMKK
ncbi:MAG: thiol:disulfide interchange protein [Bacteroidetes bacterium]|nr:thiol:disulfide interchange protein [Bacteroidota bacterium]